MPPIQDYGSNSDINTYWNDVLIFFDNIYPHAVSIVKTMVGFLIGISIPLSVFFLVGIVYCVEQLKRLRKLESQKYDLKVEPAFETVDQGDPVLSRRWETVQKHIDSSEQNDWKQAIIEADIILGDILEKLGYRGESIGERLKRAEPGDFKTLNEAWEAHKIRNEIAHAGSTFIMSHHEAKRVIHLYRKVFEEFYYI